MGIGALERLMYAYTGAKHLSAAGNIHNFAYLSISVTSSSGREPSGVPREVISGVVGRGYAESCR
jgi:hypothetical protein